MANAATLAAVDSNDAVDSSAATVDEAPATPTPQDRFETAVKAFRKFMREGGKRDSKIDDLRAQAEAVRAELSDLTANPTTTPDSLMYKTRELRKVNNKIDRVLEADDNLVAALSDLRAQIDEAAGDIIASFNDAG